MMPPKMFTRIALTFGVREDDPERLGHLLRIRGAADIEEVGRRRRRSSLMMSIVAMARPAPFTMQPISPSSAT